MSVVGVDSFTQVRMVLIGCAFADCIGASKHTVAIVAGRSSGDNVDFEWLALSV